jgi:hypothetical protein
MCKSLGLETAENWCRHIHEAVCEHEDGTVLWNEGVQADREVLDNMSGIIITRNITFAY